MPSIYITPALKDLIHLYGSTLYSYDISIKDRLREQANILWEAFQNKKEIACIEINNYHPEYLSQKPKVLFDANLTFQEMLKTIACEYGFQSWDQIENLGKEKLNIHFEKAVDTLLSGDLETLKIQINNHPDLINQVSQYPHQATLLHYVSSNGFEIHRQVVPMNLPEITKYLLQVGADPNAKMQVYGGAFSVYELLTTSAHPLNAGIMEAMKSIFK